MTLLVALGAAVGALGGYVAMALYLTRRHDRTRLRVLRGLSTTASPSPVEWTTIQPGAIEYRTFNDEQRPPST